MSSGMSFFKIISSSEKLRLPQGGLRGITCNRVMVRDVHENMWALEMEKDGGDHFCFKKGWPQFYAENSLEPKDFVVFTYVGNNLFDFKLLGADACEKKGVGGPRLAVKQEVEELSAEEDEMEEELNSRKKNEVGDWHGADIFKSGMAIQPKNPYFVSRTRKPRVSELHIPKDVIAEHKLKIPATMVLVDGRGRKWEGKVRIWRDGRTWCGGGWRSLCRVNNIGVDDACICEFVRRDQDILHVLVLPVPPKS